MPLVQITIAQGRTPEVRRSLLRAVHDAVVQAAEVRPESVRVFITEVDPSHWSSGGVTLAERDGIATPQAGAAPRPQTP